MRVLVLGGDGYLGWPTAMYFSMKGHDVTVVDNYFKRAAGAELGCRPLVTYPNLIQRTGLWNKLTGNEIRVYIGDVCDYAFLSDIFHRLKPETVIHYAEQPSAPYSMMDRNKAAFTVSNNLISTLNVIYAVKEHIPYCHVIKLGTMGEYGTPEIDIEEGWLEIEHKGRRDRFLFPRQASSLYHTTKIQDTDMLWFYVRTWNLKVTDLMQGPVYGIRTDETALDEELMTHFHYDEIFGTVLNRFIVQAVAGHPLTIYGTGCQIRGYINLMDTVQCIYLSATSPPGNGELRIFNQITETFSVCRLAAMVKNAGEKLGYSVSVKNLKNPRIEKDRHYYNPIYSSLLTLGLTPHYLTESVLESMFRFAEQHKGNINVKSFFKGIKWR